LNPGSVSALEPREQRIELSSFLPHTRRRPFRVRLQHVLITGCGATVALLFILAPKSVEGSFLPAAAPVYDALLSMLADTIQGPGLIGGPGKSGIEQGGEQGPKGAPEDTLQHSGKAAQTQGGPPAVDTTYVVYEDSTARLKYFGRHRISRPYVEFFPQRNYPLYATNRSVLFRREVSVDSTGTRVLARESLAGENVRIPLSMPLDEYVKQRRKFELWKGLADEARKPKQLTARDDVGELLSTFTKIQIPIPSNPIFSIFGKPEIKLNISGAVDIKAGFRNVTSDQTQLSRFEQSRNEPDFSQEVQVNVNGTIGDKLNILADWNTQRTFEYENQLKIKYTGYEDEIVQSVEAGNVSLQTPSAFIGSSQALFGVKARFQAGPLNLTTIATQKKGQIKEVSVSGGAQEQPFEIAVWNYATNHFFVDTTYKRFYEQYYQTEPVTITADMQNEQIIEEEVWVSRASGQYDPTERQCVAFIDLDPRDTLAHNYDSLRRAEGVPGIVEVSPFTRLDRSQYELVGDGYIGVISMNVNIQESQAVAIAYKRRGGAQFGEFSRDVPQDTIVLKLVRPKSLNAVGPTYRKAWNQMLKNIYSLGGRNIKETGFVLDILQRLSGLEDQNSIAGQRLLRILQLDNYNADKTPAFSTGDGQFDFRPNRTVSVTRAEVIIPFLRPFDDGIRRYFEQNNLPLPDSTFYYPQVYDTTKTNAQQLHSSNHQYIIKGKATGEASSRYSLGFNVVEGSVRVYLGEIPLVQNVDYTVDYIIGEVVIRNERALVPGANLRITYEQNDLFQLASKTLLGARGDLSLSQNTALGFTVMNLNQQTLSDKVRLGEEPNNNTILGFDAQTTHNLPFLTSALDALPLLETREASNIRVSGEAAYMIPDPNTKKSTIVSDNNQGIAYIDDFEGARRTIPLGITYNLWTQAGPPPDPFRSGDDDSVKMNSKGKVVWFNDQNNITPLTEVYPLKTPGNPANNRITVLDIQYFPQQRGQFNYSLNVETDLQQANWGGIMKPISIAPTNLFNENINFIEIWMKIARGSPLDTLTIDMGSISEDVIPNGRLNSEDLVLNSNPNGTLNPGEDIGLDMLTDDQERVRYAELIARYPSMAADPSGDNYSWSNNSSDFSRINGTEGNKDGPGGLIPDTEDLNSNNVLDRNNSFFVYKIPLDTNRTSNPFIVGGGNAQWYQYRIPIRDYVRAIGTPTFENIETIRLSLINAHDSTALRIADFSLVGNQWQELAKNDTTFAVSVISIEDNPNYEIPPGVNRERDKTRPDENVQANEQSLLLIARGIPDGESRRAVKYYTYRALDLFYYKTMKMFVHGDASFSPAGEDADVILQFGSDTSNYYEYRAPIYPGWDPPRNDIVIQFADLTAIKQGRDSINVLSEPVPVPGSPPGAFYRVKGNPSLTQVRYIAIGLANPTGRGTGELRGDVWVNELRLTSVDDSPGWAYRVDTQLKLADFGTVSANYSRVDPNFHSLEQRFGSRQTGINWSLNTNVQLEKLFPNDWAGTSFPFSYSHSVSTIRPKYLPNSDVLVEEAAEQARAKALRNTASPDEAERAFDNVFLESESYRVTDTYAAPNFRIGFPSQAWYIRDTFNKLSFGFTYTKTRERNPATIRRLSWSWGARFAYAVTLSSDYNFTPFKDLFDGLWFLDEYKNVKIFFAPSNFSWSFGANRSRDVSLQRVAGSQETITRNFTASRQVGFGWKLTEGGLLNLSGDYNLQIESSLLDLETDKEGRQRRFSQMLDDIFFGDKFINFGRDVRYGQRNQFNTRPNIPNIFNIKKYLDLTFTYNVDYTWQNTLQRGDIGKSAGWNNNISVSMNFRLKQLMDPLFGDAGPGGAPPGGGPRGRRGDSGPKDTTGTVHADSSGRGLGKTLDQLKELLRVFVKAPLFDYDNINISFTQTNTAQNSGVVGRPGFVNFWGRLPFQEADPKYGPSRLYQLGLISDPSGRLTNFGSRPRFPFFGWDVEPGVRAPSGVLANTFRQTNRLNFKTTRSLWEGARLDLIWNIGWSYNRTQNITTDSLGHIIPTSINTTTTGTVDRSFLTFPDVLFLGVFKSSLKDVSKKYAELKRDSTLTEDEKINRAFQEGFEALPFLRKLFGEHYPRINWTLRWDGLERISFFSGFVNRLSLDHAYASTYSRSFRNLPSGGGEVTDGQRVTYGFSPLVGMNFTFKELLKGSFGANLRYNTNTSYDLAAASKNLVEVLAQEISFTASYSRRGFEIPFFGVSLNNDLDVSASYSVAKNTRRTFEVTKLDINTEGTPLEGSTRTVLEPRIKYVLSSRVNASIYYRYTKIEPDAQGSRVPGSTTNEAGLDIHISIQ
jgi:hypothetical protein